MTDREKRIVMAVFGALLHEHTWSELNAAPFSLGSLTIDEMQDVYNHLKYEDYCKKNRITYEQMTEDDFIWYEEEKAREMGYDI